MAEWLGILMRDLQFHSQVLREDPPWSTFVFVIQQCPASTVTGAVEKPSHHKALILSTSLSRYVRPVRYCIVKSRGGRSFTQLGSSVTRSVSSIEYNRIYCTYPTLLPSEWTVRFPLRKTLKKSRRPVSQMFSPAQGLPWQLLAAVGTCKWKCLVDWRRIFRPWMGEVWLARCYSRMHASQFIDKTISVHEL